MAPQIGLTSNYGGQSVGSKNGRSNRLSMHYQICNLVSCQSGIIFSALLIIQRQYIIFVVPSVIGVCNRTQCRESDGKYRGVVVLSIPYTMPHPFHFFSFMHKTSSVDLLGPR